MSKGKNVGFLIKYKEHFWDLKVEKNMCFFQFQVFLMTLEY